MKRTKLAEFTFLLLIIVIFSYVIFSPHYTGKVTVGGGNVSRVDLSLKITDDYWYGLYGNVSLYQNSNSTEVGTRKIANFNPAVMGCEGAELYATTLDSIDWKNLEPAGTQMVDNFLAVSSSSPYSGTSIFTQEKVFNISNTTMVLNSTSTITDTGNSHTGLLKHNETLVFVTKISPINASTGVSADYQVMLPAIEETTYNFFIDENDYARCNLPPEIEKVRIGGEFKQDETVSFEITYSDPNNDPVTIDSNLDSYKIVNSSTGYRVINWTPAYDDVGFKNITFILTDTYNNKINKTIQKVIENKNDPPVIEYVSDINAYLHKTYTDTYIARDLDAYVNESIDFEFGTSPHLDWVNFETRFNETDNKFYGRVNLTPLKSHKGTHNISIIATDGIVVTKQPITLHVGYCGDFDAAGEPKCDTRYENCENCPEDCGICPTEQKESMALKINRSRDKNKSIVKALQLVPRTTCEEKGEIIRDMEVCGVVEKVKISKYREKNNSWVFEREHYTNKEGLANLTTKLNETYRILASKEGYYPSKRYIGKSFRYIGEDEISIEDNETIDMKDNETEEQPREEEPKQVTKEEELNYKKLFYFYFGVLFLIGLLCYIVHLEYYKDKNEQ